MKIALLNGSPKGRGSASEILLEGLRPYLPADALLPKVHLPLRPQEDFRLSCLADCQALVFAFPLYVDSLPSHVIRALESLTELFREIAEKPTVYAVVNCGFYEGQQAHIALHVRENWVSQTGVLWCRGPGIGGGGVLSATGESPVGQFPKREIGKALAVMGQSVSALESGKTLFVNCDLPRFVYRQAAEAQWKKRAQNNGVSPRDLGKRR